MLMQNLQMASTYKGAQGFKILVPKWGIDSPPMQTYRNLKIPKFKHQITNKTQFPIFNDQNRRLLTISLSCEFFAFYGKIILNWKMSLPKSNG